MMTAPVVLMSEEEVASFGRSTESGFGALRTERGVLLPLAAMDVDAAVAGVVASIEIAQTFVNTTGSPIEATYIFPLPDRAAVNRFRMEVGGRVVEGVVDERGAAREQYEQAIAKGHRAAITEEERPGVFTLRVGNLMPGDRAVIRLSLVGPLPIDDGEVTFQFPLVVAPRYMPGAGLTGEQAGLGIAGDTTLVPDASRISPPVLLPGMTSPVRLGVRVALLDHHVRDARSSLHAVHATNRDARIIELTGAEKLDRDFILRWRVDSAQLTSSLVCSDDADGKAGSFVLTLVPPSTVAVAQKSRDVVFVIDRSGSMGGWKMLAARRATARMVDTLTSRDRFQVLAFDDHIEAFPERQLAHATDRNRFRAVEQLAKVDARGGTELAAPLHMATGLLAGGTDDRERVIVLVTDGQVGNEDHILREITPNLRNVRVFTLGIDQAVNAGFLRRFAASGGGLCELVESEDRLDDVMAKVHHRIGTPVLTELAVTATDLPLDTERIAPKRLPDVYAGAPVTIFGRYHGKAPANATLQVRGTSYGDPLAFHVAREASSSSIPWVAASWARAYLRDLEDRYAAGAHTLEPEIIRVSKTFGVLCRFTAFLAVDRSTVVNPGGGLVQVVQPVESPAGWEDQTCQPVAQSIGHMFRRSMAAPAPRAVAASIPMPGVPGGGAMDATLFGAAGAAGSAGADDEAAMELESLLEAPNVGAPPPPASPPPSIRQSFAKKAKREVDAAPQASVYLAKLAELARDLEARLRGTPDLAALRLLRQRLREWVEDLRSVGGHDVLATAVYAHVEGLGLLLAAPSLDVAALSALAAALTAIATGTPPPAPRSTRGAFWK